MLVQSSGASREVSSHTEALCSARFWSQWAKEAEYTGVKMFLKIHNDPDVKMFSVVHSVTFREAYLA